MLKRIVGAITVVAAALAVSSCGVFEDKFEQSWNGISATMTTYTQDGGLIDKVHGRSFRMERDTEFDTTDSKGNSNEDSQVLLISIGSSHISHVGSSMIMAQDDLTNVMESVGTRFDLNNSKPGTPWLNDLKYRFLRYWTGKARTVMVRSQNGSPIAVYVGNEVQVLSTSVPKSTWFRIDGKSLFVYRSDYTVYDNDLL